MVIIAWIFFTFVVAAIGGNRKIGFWGAFFISLLLSPLIGLIITLISPSNETHVITTTTNAPQQPVTITLELERLKKLKDDGTIDDTEFQKLKNQLLEKV